MTQTAYEVAKTASGEAKLPRRDWIILPLLSLLTVCIMAVTTEVVAWHLMPESKVGIAKCLIQDDPATGVRGVPNTTCTEKLPETDLIVYKFNSCGHRAGMPCGPKPPGVFRIVIAGSSVAMGMRVQEEHAFPSLLAAELSRQLGRKVEIYSEGMEWGTPHSTVLRFKEVLDEQPDLILYPVTPWDIENVDIVVPPPPEAPRHEGPVKTAFQMVKSSRTAMLLLSLLYKSPTSYAKVRLIGAGAPGYLHAQPGPEWDKRLAAFDGYVAEMEAQSKAAGIPFVAVMIPNRVQAAMVSMGQWPAGFDPYKLDELVGADITRHGGTYLDIMHKLQTIPNSEQHYFPTDGHPDAAGHVMLTQLLDQALTSGAVPELKPTNTPATTGQAR